ncbi:MAG: hypothetical protein J6C54_00005, partial [Lachnospiraceae bacterium]|nr:hypothetical protein [Lachnospiraceae bacterium]
MGTILGFILGYAIAAIVISPTGMMSTYFDLPDWALVMPPFCIPVVILTNADTATIGDVIEISPYGSEETYEVKVAGYLRSLMTESIVMTEDYADS